MSGVSPSQPTTMDVELLKQKLEFAEFEWNRATDGMKERDARIQELEGALRKIEAKTDGDRPTVNEGNIFKHWGILNLALVNVREIARAALQPKAGS